MFYQSAYVKSPWNCELRSLPLPDSLPDAHVLIRVEACGICGTDLSHAENGMEEWQPFGHEVAGVVERIGAHCDDLQVGDTVVLESSGFCGRCEWCRDGRVDLCNKAPNFWRSGSSLGFSEFMIVPACCVVRYSGMPPETACLAEPAGVAYDMVKTADIRHGDRVCIVGPGPIGLMAIPMAIRSGADEVVCVGRARNRKRLEAAEKLGARIVASDLLLSEQEELHGHFDRVLVTAPVGIIPQALRLLVYGGILSYIGIGTEDGIISFDANDFHYRKLQLRASFASPAIYYPTVLKMLKKGTLPADTIISHRMPLSDMAKAMAMCKEDKGATIKVVITPERRLISNGS